MLTLVKRLVQEEEGQTMAEYALILVLIAIAAFAGYKLLGENIKAKVDDVAGKIGS
ncbi:MAG: Flp family type IVb pilin [bacterium]|jgi:Flp pilus assembly pilin Flp